MRLITIQHKNVLKTLLSGQVYYAPPTVSKNLQKPYQKMLEHYKWYVKAPVFACVEGRYCEFYGAKTEKSCILVLDVPDEQIKLQGYYNWVDVIYFTELPGEWDSIMSLEKFTEYTLDGKNIRDRDAVQATIPYIHPNWLSNYRKKFNKYVGSGGNYILEKVM